MPEQVGRIKESCFLIGRHHFIHPEIGFGHWNVAAKLLFECQPNQTGHRAATLLQSRQKRVVVTATFAQSGAVRAECKARQKNQIQTAALGGVALRRVVRVLLYFPVCFGQSLVLVQRVQLYHFHSIGAVLVARNEALLLIGQNLFQQQRSVDLRFQTQIDAHPLRR